MLNYILKFFMGDIEIKGKKIPNKVIVAFIAGVVIILTILLYVSNTPDRSGLYKNLAWGTDWSNVLDILEHDKDISNIVENESKLSIIYSIDCPEGKSDISITGVASFDENKTLQEVGLMILKEDGSQYSDDELIHELCYRFNDLYGNYTEDGLNYAWLTDESEISFMYISDGFFLLQYADINSVK